MTKFLNIQIEMMHKNLMYKVKLEPTNYCIPHKQNDYLCSVMEINEVTMHTEKIGRWTVVWNIFAKLDYFHAFKIAQVLFCCLLRVNNTKEYLQVYEKKLEIYSHCLQKFPEHVQWSFLARI
jgi:hypothetical protein